jgi:hypothetical protein
MTEHNSPVSLLRLPGRRLWSTDSPFAVLSCQIEQQHEVAEAKKRRSNAKFDSDMGNRRSATPTVWPCQIDGCTKTFVREADLKRHQKTTKTHSNPSL